MVLAQVGMLTALDLTPLSHITCVGDRFLRWLLRVNGVGPDTPINATVYAPQNKAADEYQALLEADPTATTPPALSRRPHCPRLGLKDAEITRDA